MGDVSRQLNEFKHKLSQSLEQEEFDELEGRLDKQIDPYLLKCILYNALSQIKIHDFLSYKNGDGYVFLRRETGLAFDYYIGRNYDGDFQLILIPNSKNRDGLVKKHKLTKEGSYKIGKDAKGILLSDPSNDNYYRLSSENTEQALNEKRFSQVVDSPHVARYMSSQIYKDKKDSHKHIEDQKNKILLIMPKAIKGDLLEIITKTGNTSQFNLIEEFSILFEMIAGVRHIHNTVHGTYSVTNRDIKPNNMVLTVDSHLLIIDHGSWLKSELKSTNELNARTSEYCSPTYLEYISRIYKDKYAEHEVFKKSYSKSFWQALSEEERKNLNVRLSGKREDVWSLAASIFDFITKHPPSVYGLSRLDDNQYFFLKAMLKADAEKRCTSDEALQLYLKHILNNYYYFDRKDWILHMMSYYQKNHYHRTRFLCELYLAGFDDYIDELPNELKTLMPFDKLLD